MGLVWPVADRPRVGRFLPPLGYDWGGRLRRPASEGSCIEVGAWWSVSVFGYPPRPGLLDHPRGQVRPSISVVSAE